MPESAADYLTTLSRKTQDQAIERARQEARTARKAAHAAVMRGSGGVGRVATSVTVTPDGAVLHLAGKGALVRQMERAVRKKGVSR
jgi:hypothetical protein